MMPEGLSRSAIILAAGRGSRMGGLTADRPKCLLEVAGRPVIDWQVACLTSCGIREIVVVTGYRDAQVRAHLNDRVSYVVNRQYSETNSLYSLWLARSYLAPGALILNSDVLFSPRLIDRLLRAPAPDAVLVEPGRELGPEEMKVQTRSGFVVDFGKELSPAAVDGENVGIAKFSAAGGARLIACLDALVDAGHRRAWAPLAFREFARTWPLRAVSTLKLPWIELDFPEDLERARRAIAPAIAALELRSPAGDMVAA